ncbi:MAG TPA: AI-2E family transporter [Bacteroidales bacterium]|nr:AI-2E family transporter [Bacteroidales bacterium]
MLKAPKLDRTNKILLFTILISVILYFGKEFFVLITFSGLLAMLMTPVSNWLEKRGMTRVFSSLLSVFILLTVVSAIVLLLSAQINNIGKELPQIQLRFEELISDLQSWISDNLGVSSEQLKDKTSGALPGAGNILTGIVKGTFSFIGRFILVLVFTFLFVLQRDKYENFVVMLSPENERDETTEMINKISKIAQQYLTGRIIAAFIIGILYIIGFSIIDLKDGLILSAIAALVTIIPYVGALLGGLIPFFMTFINGSFEQSLWVVIIISIVNAIDHYFIEPYIVGGSVSISPFFTILILILGGVIWGLAGIILFLPLLGILKIIFENVEGLKPYAYLIGDQRKTSAHAEIWLKIKTMFSGRKKKN